MKKKLMMALSLVLVAAMSIGGTIAYLTARSDTATNTFTVGSIGSLVLEETGLTANDRTNEYTVAPGVNITKDPWVSYTHSTANPVDVYVYVTIAAATPWEFFQNGDKYAIQTKQNEQNEDQLSWTVAEGWTYLTTDNGKQVYYRTVAANATLSQAPVIADNTITVSGSAIDSTISVGNIVFESFAIQQAGFANADAAWTALKTELG